MSAANVEEPPNIPPGTWSLLIHGNCPRCSHHHKATAVRIQVSEDPSEATPVQCERCEHRWLTIGGRNNTQTSLLSTQTHDPDTEEIGFRSTLFKFVRSATALDSVPEASAREQSHGEAILDPSNGDHGDQESNASNEAALPINMHHPGSNSNRVMTPPPTRRVRSVRRELLSNNVRLAKVLLEDLKRKLRHHIPVLKRVHVRKRNKIRSSGQPVNAAEPSQSSEVEQEPTTPKPPSTEPELVSQAAEKTDASSQQVQSGTCAPAKTLAQAVEELESFGKDRLKDMTSEQRDAWVREKITAFKCCSRQCACRLRRASSSMMIDSSTQVHILPLIPCEQLPRRHSFEGIGSHFSQFTPGEFFDGRSLTISATRDSESDTAVESNTVNTNPRNSRVGLPVHRPRSLSPRPASLRNPRHSQHLASRLEGRPSMDSVVVRSSSRGGRRGAERLSNPVPAITSHPEAPGHEEQATPIPVEVQQRTTTPPPPETPNPYTNGHLTHDEQYQPSASRPETPQT